MSAGPAALSQDIAHFTSRFSYDDLPQRLKDFARYHVLDVIGTALAAINTDFARAAYGGLAPLNAGGTSTLVGIADKLALRDAMLMNGILAHGLDYDDTHTQSQVHPTVSAFPCALGLAEFLDKGGREMLTAYVLGAEIAVRFGLAANNTMQVQGFHPTGVVGHLGCAVTAAHLYGLDAYQTVMAQGIAGTMASALGEYRSDGSWIKRMHAGWAAVGGTTAASLARGGFVGSLKIYEGRDGLLRSHAGARFPEVDAPALTRDLGNVWHVEGSAIKPLPACHLLHACADSALALKRDHGLEPEDVVEATALLHPDTFRVVCEPVELRRKPPSENVAQFSAQFVIAACLTHGRLGFPELSGKGLRNERVLALAQRVSHAAYPDSKYPKYLSGGVIVKTRDGRTLEHLEEINRGNGERALTNDDIVSKYMENASMAIDRTRAERIRDGVLGCDRISVRELAAALRAAGCSLARPGA